MKSVVLQKKAGVNQKNVPNVLRPAQCRKKKTRSHPAAAVPAKNNFTIDSPLLISLPGAVLFSSIPLQCQNIYSFLFPVPHCSAG